MANERLSGLVELKVPADSGMMLVVRLTAAGVLARAGLTIDEVDNLKMAVEEACNCLISQENPPRQLELGFQCAEGALEICVCGRECGNCSGSMDETELEVARCIMTALADEVDFETENGWVAAIRIRNALTH